MPSSRRQHPGRPQGPVARLPGGWGVEGGLRCAGRSWPLALGRDLEPRAALRLLLSNWTRRGLQLSRAPSPVPVPGGGDPALSSELLRGSQNSQQLPLTDTPPPTHYAQNQGPERAAPHPKTHNRAWERPGARGVRPGSGRRGKHSPGLEWIRDRGSPRTNGISEGGPGPKGKVGALPGGHPEGRGLTGGGARTGSARGRAPGGGSPCACTGAAPPAPARRPARAGGSAAARTRSRRAG